MESSQSNPVSQERMDTGMKLPLELLADFPSDVIQSAPLFPFDSLVEPLYPQFDQALQDPIDGDICLLEPSTQNRINIQCRLPMNSHS